jgi:hypothetical protein
MWGQRRRVLALHSLALRALVRPRQLPAWLSAHPAGASVAARNYGLRALQRLQLANQPTHAQQALAIS